MEKDSRTEAEQVERGWREWTQALPRMAAANLRAEEAFLASLSLEEGLRIFEELCAEDWGVKEDLDDAPAPVPLARLWRQTP